MAAAKTDLSICVRGTQHVALAGVCVCVCVCACVCEDINYRRRHSAPERAGEAIDENPQDAAAPACVKLRSGPIVIAQVEREAT